MFFVGFFRYSRKTTRQYPYKTIERQCQRKKDKNRKFLTSLTKKKFLSLKELAEYYGTNTMTYQADGETYELKCQYLDGGTSPMVVFYDESHVRQFKGTKIFSDGTYKTRPRRIRSVAQIYTVMGKKFNKVLFHNIPQDSFVHSNCFAFLSVFFLTSHGSKRYCKKS